jgi:hypothetical protein
MGHFVHHVAVLPIPAPPSTDERAEFDFQGFRAVYLLPYPEDVIVLSNANGS